jgi:DnaJ-class molecular chaperone
MTAQDPNEGVKNPEAVPEGTPASGENTCRACAGRGRVDGKTCPECDGSEKVVTPVGGAGSAC